MHHIAIRHESGSLWMNFTSNLYNNTLAHECVIRSHCLDARPCWLQCSMKAPTHPWNKRLSPGLWANSHWTRLPYLYRKALWLWFTMIICFCITKLWRKGGDDHLSFIWLCCLYHDSCCAVAFLGLVCGHSGSLGLTPLFNARPIIWFKGQGNIQLSLFMWKPQGRQHNQRQRDAYAHPQSAVQEFRSLEFTLTKTTWKQKQPFLWR